MAEAPRTPSVRSGYERPALAHRCGRAARWDRPCWQGPDLQGRCGGEAECRPVKAGDRWMCRRPAVAGGACAEGPLPHGRCAHTRPPCLPRASLRRIRGRLSLMASMLVVALIAGFVDFSPSPRAGVAAFDPGPISNVHAGFTGEPGCAACHAEHGLSSLQWLRAAFRDHDQDQRCLGCHGFEGAERSPHNRDFPERPDLAQPGCAACHHEHRGGEHDVAQVDDRLCANCHQPAVTHFGQDHPPFPPAYPYQIPNHINFDHNEHLHTYFDPDSRYLKQADRDPEFAAKAREACTTCHAVETASREVTPREFEETCAGCHRHQVRDRPLVLLRPFEPTPLLVALLGLGEDWDEDQAIEQGLRLFEAMAEEGLAALAARLEALSDAVPPRELLEGLSNVLVKDAAAAWKEEEEFEGPERSELETGGWAAGYDEDGNQSLRYTPRRHSDPVIIAWVRYLRAQLGDEPKGPAAEAALDYVLDESRGAGACGKCHRAGVRSEDGGRSTLREAAGLAARWTFAGPPERPYTAYSHRPHIDILGPERSCLTCHRMNREADYAGYFTAETLDPARYQSNFHAIAKETCDRCHAEGRVAIRCQTCHRFHRAPGFKQEFQALEPRFNQPAAG